MLVIRFMMGLIEVILTAIKVLMVSVTLGLYMKVKTLPPLKNILMTQAVAILKKEQAER